MVNESPPVGSAEKISAGPSRTTYLSYKAQILVGDYPSLYDRMSFRNFQERKIDFRTFLTTTDVNRRGGKGQWADAVVLKEETRRGKGGFLFSLSLS